MGTDTHGWIEIRTEPGTFWEPMILVDALPFRDYVVFGSIFDVRCGSSDRTGQPLAADRGIPFDLSPYIKSEVQLEGSTQLHHSWVLWSELQNTWLATDLCSPLDEPLTMEWFVLRGLMAVLGEYYGGNHVRLVVWFNTD